MARRSGILLHLTSLPSLFGIGDMGPEAYRFADFLERAGQRLWQILPLVPTDTLMGDSPYSSTSAFAGNPLLISPEKLVEDGLLRASDLSRMPAFPSGRVDYRHAAACKEKILDEAWTRFSACAGGLRYEYETFCRDEKHWLDGYCLFRALKTLYGRQAWNRWPGELRIGRVKGALRDGGTVASLAEKECFRQFMFFRQWRALKDYCNGLGVLIMGDLPCYVHHDSADVWGNPSLFKLDAKGRPAFVAGVPPDYFSRTGQLWGNPVYDWDALKKSRYGWWVDRVRHNLKLFNLVRVDHCRGLVAYWEVPAGRKTAAKGRWVPAPVDDFFRVLTRAVPRAGLVAEDLGDITPDVRAVLDRLALPGMRVLQFAFGRGEGARYHAPHRHIERDFVYTGTHDNNTVRGWFEKEAVREDRERLFAYLGRRVGSAQIHVEMVRLAMMSVASTAVIPMQDVLGMGEEARMNRPAGKGHYWRWRLLAGQTDRRLALWLRELAGTYGRV